MSDPEFDEPQSDAGGLRRQLENLQRELRETKESLPAQLQEAEDRGATAAQRRFDATEVLGDLGFPGLASVWTEKHPEGELSKDAATAFLAELGLQPGTADVTPPPATEPVTDEVKTAAQDFQRPVAPTGTGDLLDRGTFDEMMRAGGDQRADALKAASEGRVKLNNPGASEHNAGVLRIGSQ